MAIYVICFEILCNSLHLLLHSYNSYICYNFHFLLTELWRVKVKTLQNTSLFSWIFSYFSLFLSLALLFLFMTSKRQLFTFLFFTIFVLIYKLPWILFYVSTSLSCLLARQKKTNFEKQEKYEKWSWRWFEWSCYSYSLFFSFETSKKLNHK